MAVDSTEFEGVARRVIRRGLADRLPRYKAARDEYIEAEAQSLAYSLAEVTEQRLDDLRAASIEAERAT